MWLFISLTMCLVPLILYKGIPDFFFFSSQVQVALGEREDNLFQSRRGSDSHINAGVLGSEVWFCLFFGGRIMFVNYRIGGLGFCY